MRAADEIILDYLQLIRTPGLGPRRVQALLARYSRPKAALAALRERPDLFGKKPICLIERGEAERELDYGKSIGAQFLTWADSAYPSYLREIDSPPPALAVKGNIALLGRPCLAIVGSRNASAIGSRLSAQFARALGGAGFVIVSGFARGIDSYAHQAALKTGTIAVMAGGIDHIYPPENKKLYQQILAQGGAFISEMPLGWVPRAVDFPRRNRLIAGLALGLTVIEASERSGSLISARYAAEAGRIVFAVPGSPLDPRAKGTNGLIKDGACLADDPLEIAATLAPLLERHALAPNPPPAPRPMAGPQLDDAADEYALPAAEPPAETAKSAPRRAAAANAAPAAPSPRQTMPAPSLAPPAPAAESAAPQPGELTESEKRLLCQSLSPVPCAIDNLAAITGLALPRLYLGLMELELAGRLIRHNGGMVSARPD